MAWNSRFPGKHKNQQEVEKLQQQAQAKQQLLESVKAQQAQGTSVQTLSQIMKETYVPLIKDQLNAQTFPQARKPAGPMPKTGIASGTSQYPPLVTGTPPPWNPNPYQQQYPPGTNPFTMANHIDADGRPWSVNIVPGLDLHEYRCVQCGACYPISGAAAQNLSIVGKVLKAHECGKITPPPMIQELVYEEQKAQAQRVAEAKAKEEQDKVDRVLDLIQEMTADD